MTLMCRRRKVMRLRRRMLRRKTDPKTGKHTLCGPARATCACTFHNSHVVWKFTGIMAAEHLRRHCFVRACAIKMPTTGDKSHFVWKLTGQTTKDTCGDIVLCEPAQATCAGTFHKNPCCIEIYKKNGRGHLWGHRFVQACAVDMHMDTSQEPFCIEIYKTKRPETPAGTSFCASLRNRNAQGHFTRAILC